MKLILFTCDAQKNEINATCLSTLVRKRTVEAKERGRIQLNFFGCSTLYRTENLVCTRKYLERSSRCSETLKQRRAFIRLRFILPFFGECLNATTKKVKGKGIVSDDELYSRVLENKTSL